MTALTATEPKVAVAPEGGIVAIASSASAPSSIASTSSGIGGTQGKPTPQPFSSIASQAPRASSGMSAVFTGDSLVCAVDQFDDALGNEVAHLPDFVHRAHAQRMG